MPKLEIFPFRGHSNEKNIDLQYVYTTFRRMLFERLLTIFIYDGTPFPQRELEYRLFKSGAVAIVQDIKVGTMATWASLNGVTEYLDIYKYVTYNAPTAKGGTCRIGKTAVVAYNDSLRQQLQSHVDLYASLLAHAYMTIKLSLINIRYQDVFVADNDNTKTNIQNWYKSLYNGKPMAIVQETLIGLGDAIKNVTPSDHKVDIMQLIDSYNELWRAFYRDIGIRFAKDKRANMVTSEVNSDQQLLLYNIDDMYRQRQKLCEDYNYLFVDKMHWQTNYMTVKINPLFDIIREGDTIDDDNVGDVSDDKPESAN